MTSSLSTHEKIQLFFKCFNLIDADTFSKSDPYVNVYLVEPNPTGGKPKKSLLGKTEVIQNNLNPVFKTPIEMNYFFEVRQLLFFEVFDRDRNSNDDFLGSVECSVGDILSCKKSTRRMNLENKKNKGEIEVTAVPVLQGRVFGAVQFSLRAQNLKKMKLIGKSDPFMLLQRLLPNGEYQTVYKSEILKKELNPQWRPSPWIEMTDLCGCDSAARCLKLVCCSEKEKYVIGETGLLTADEVIHSTNEKQLDLILPGDPKRRKTDKCQGTLLLRASFTPSVGFLEHLQAGLEINIAFSIDFTGSNGDWRKPNSLHHYNPTTPNDYLQAMLAVSNVVQEYDSDRQFPVFGFGAIAPFTKGTSHFFPLNGNPVNAYCNGMQEVIDTYARILPQLQFSGPTNFAPTIINVCEGARAASPKVYTILLILTDGAITDMQDTVDAIVAADDAPLSIVIIGIGNANFGSMVRLDGDDEPLEDRRGRVTRRDLVQFVPFNEYRSRGAEQLAAEVLYEIPRQVEVWGRLNHIQY